jgi:diacylglycerol kinase (ATP)
MDIRRATLVVNARSRSGEQAFSQASELLRSLGVPIEEEYALRDPARLPETVRRAVTEGADLIVLGGGDGSVSSVVDFLVEGEAVLGLLPLGTANDFARTLGIPSDVQGACQTIAYGEVVDVDLGLAGEDYFVNVASVGLGVEVTRALSRGLKRRAGAIAYPIAAIRAFFSHQPFSATLTFPNGDHPQASFDRLLQVAVGNGRFYGGGLAVAPGADIDDRSRDVYAIELGRSRDLLGVIRYLRSGEFIYQEGVHYCAARAVQIETDPPLPINIDGELVDRPPERFLLVPEALT